MPTFTKVFAGIALSTALVGGALALGATAAAANSSPNHEKTVDHKWWLDNANQWWNDQNNWWNNNLHRNSKDDKTTFGLAAKDVAIGFQDKTIKDDWFNNNLWFNNNNWWANQDKNWWDKDHYDKDKHHNDD